VPPKQVESLADRRKTRKVNSLINEDLGSEYDKLKQDAENLEVGKGKPDLQEIPEEEEDQQFKAFPELNVIREEEEDYAASVLIPAGASPIK